MTHRKDERILISSASPTVKKFWHVVPSRSPRGARDRMLIEGDAWRPALADRSGDRTNPHRRIWKLYRFRESRVQVIPGGTPWPSSWHTSPLCTLASVTSSPSPGAICHATLPRAWYTCAALTRKSRACEIMPSVGGHDSAAEGRR